VQIESYDLQMQRKSGEIIDVQYLAESIDISDRRHLLVMLTDVAKLCETQRALETHQERLEEQVSQRTAEPAAKGPIAPRACSWLT
jgi:hypothetical protein